VSSSSSSVKFKFKFKCQVQEVLGAGVLLPTATATATAAVTTATATRDRYCCTLHCKVLKIERIEISKITVHLYSFFGAIDFLQDGNGRNQM